MCTLNSVFWLFLIIPAYLIGTIPFSVYVAKLAGHDLYKSGSGNPGASNVARVAGWKWGVIAMACDILKGLLPTLFVMTVVDNYTSAQTTRALGYAVGISVVVGHALPFYRKGGKGIATAGGVALVLYPILAIGVIVFWALLIKLTKYPVVASLSATMVFTFYLGFKHQYFWEFLVVFLLFVFVTIRHAPNIARLVKGNEHGVQT